MSPLEMGSNVERSFDRGAMSRSEDGAAFTRLSLRTRKRKLPEPHAGHAGALNLARVRNLDDIPATHGLGSPQSPRAVHDFRLLPESSPTPGSTKPNRHRLRGRSNTTSHRGPGLIQESSAVCDAPGTSDRMQQARRRVLPLHLREVHTISGQRQHDRGRLCRVLWFHSIHHRLQDRRCARPRMTTSDSAAECVAPRRALPLVRRAGCNHATFR